MTDLSYRSRLHFSWMGAGFFLVFGFLLSIFLRYYLSGKGFQEILLYYPLAFLPLFIFRVSAPPARFQIAETIVVILLFTIFRYAGYFALAWAMAVWSGLCLLRAFNFQTSIFGKILIFLAPPFQAKFIALFDFPLRLFLTRCASRMLSLFDSSASAVGNLIDFHGNSFVVDPACDGLKMAVATMILFLYFLYKNAQLRQHAVLRAKRAILFSMAILILWMLGNLMRIVFLVMFNIPPYSWMHTFVGIICFSILVLLPYLIMMETFFTVSIKAALPKNLAQPFRWQALILIVVMTFFMLKFPMMRDAAIPAWPEKLGTWKHVENLKIDERFYKATMETVYIDGVREMIIKRRLDPVRVSHPARQCWSGSGYKIMEEDRLLIPLLGEARLMKAKKGDKEIGIAWWYASLTGLKKNGRVTDSEIMWRIKKIKENRNYFQINLIFTNNIERHEIIRQITEVQETLEHCASEGLILNR